MSREEPEATVEGSGDSSEGGPSPVVYFFLSLVLLAFSVGGWVWLQGNVPEPGPTPIADIAPTIGPLPTGVEDIPGDAFGLVTGLATPWAVPGGPGETPTIESPTATPAITAVPIPVLGPPAGSFFRPEDTISFYWSGAAEPTPDRQYSVYLIDGDERVLLGSIAQPNLGQGYQLRANISDFVEEPGAYSWLVVLEDAGLGVIIGQSDIRPISLVGAN